MSTGSSLVVRDYARSNVKNGKSDTASSGELIARGRSLVSVVEARDGWQTISPPSDPSLHLGERLVLKNLPPSSSSFRRDLRDLRFVEIAEERNANPEARGILDVSQLEKFEGTDFSYLLRRENSLKLPGRDPEEEKQTENDKRKRKRDVLSEANDGDEYRKKKPRSSTSTVVSLHDLIPNPHHHPYSPLNRKTNMDITKRFSPYLKSPFVPIMPCTSSKADAYLKDPYARGAWIIPVDGKLPWKEASPAQLMDDLPGRGPQEGRCPSISWTPTLIRKFWADLLEIRKQGVLGAVSLSYHVASAEKSQLNDAKATLASRSSAKKAAVRRSAKSDTPKTLEQCTYIKVYHDVRYVMYLRSVFDAWRTEVELLATSIASRVTMSPRRTRSAAGPGSASESAPTPQKTKVRPLQGVKLVLLDEVGQGVGTC